MAQGRKLLLFVNDPGFLVSHRLPVALAAREAGYEVHTATADGPAVAELQRQGLITHVLPLSRQGRNPLSELRLLVVLWRLLRQIRPDLLHTVTIKPVIYGGLAGRLAGVRAVVAAVSGLGAVFIATGFKARLIRTVVTALYRLALRRPGQKVIFQNPDDRAAFVGQGLVREADCVMIRGSGVDLSAYPYVPEPEGVPVVIFAARLLRDKGIEEFIGAARLLRQQGIQARFLVVGAPDPGNPASVTAADVARWQAEGVVECLGHRTDIAALFAAANLVVLPSYREGLPRVLVEAAACGRAVVTTDVPGCRSAIEAGTTGLLVPVRDTAGLAEGMQALITDAPRRRAMGQAGRALAERAFDIHSVVAQHLAVYRDLL